MDGRLFFLAAALATFALFMSVDADANAEVGVAIVSGANAEDTEQYRFEVYSGRVYLFTTAELTDIRVLGQGVVDESKSSLVTMGFGFRQGIVEGLEIYGEAGWGILDLKFHEQQVDEVAYTYLANRHANDGRPIPYGTCYRQEECNRGSEMTMDNAFVGRIGVIWNPYKDMHFRVGYRFMNSRTYIAAYDLDKKANGGGYWEESYGTDLGAWEVGISWRF